MVCQRSAPVLSILAAANSQPQQRVCYFNLVDYSSLIYACSDALPTARCFQLAAMRFFARMRLDTAAALQCPHATAERPCTVVVDGITLAFGRRHFEVDPLAPPSALPPIKTGDKPEKRMAVWRKADRALLRQIAESADYDAQLFLSLEDRDLAATVQYIAQNATAGNAKHGILTPNALLLDLTTR